MSEFALALQISSRAVADIIVVVVLLPIHAAKEEEEKEDGESTETSSREFRLMEKRERERGKE